MYMSIYIHTQACTCIHTYTHRYTTLRRPRLASFCCINGVSAAAAAGAGGGTDTDVAGCVFVVDAAAG